MKILLKLAQIPKYAATFLILVTSIAATVSIIKSIKFPQLSNQKKQQNSDKIPAGIYNQGNTCFVNSLLQALAPLKYFLESLNTLLLNYTEYNQKMTNNSKLIYQLNQSLKKINTQNNTININQFLQSINQCAQIINLQQQDAYQLYSIIIKSLQQLYNQQKKVSLKRSSLSNRSEYNIQQSYISYTNDTDQQISNVLQGYMKSSIICTGCKQQQNIKIQSFYDLSLDIKPVHIVNVQDAIAHLQQSQCIEGYACVRCSVNDHVNKLNNVMEKVKRNKGSKWEQTIRVCKKLKQLVIRISQQQQQQVKKINQRWVRELSKISKQNKNIQQEQQVYCQIKTVYRRIKKQCVISKYPKILVLHLNQLCMNQVTGELFLLKKYLEFQSDISFLLKQQAKKYKLVSLISHIGDQTFGHYYTFRKFNQQSNQWFWISDSSISHCDQDFVKKNMPYMLFYQQNQQNLKQNKINF